MTAEFDLLMLCIFLFFFFFFFIRKQTSQRGLVTIPQRLTLVISPHAVIWCKMWRALFCNWHICLHGERTKPSESDWKDLFSALFNYLLLDVGVGAHLPQCANPRMERKKKSIRGDGNKDASSWHTKKRFMSASCMFMTFSRQSKLTPLPWAKNTVCAQYLKTPRSRLPVVQMFA